MCVTFIYLCTQVDLFVSTAVRQNDDAHSNKVLGPTSRAVLTVKKVGEASLFVVLKSSDSTLKLLSTDSRGLHK